MADRRFVLSKGPHLRKADFPKVYGTGAMMKDLFIALLPLVIFGFLKTDYSHLFMEILIQFMRC